MRGFSSQATVMAYSTFRELPADRLLYSALQVAGTLPGYVHSKMSELPNASQVTQVLCSSCSVFHLHLVTPKCSRMVAATACGGLLRVRVSRPTHQRIFTLWAVYDAGAKSQRIHVPQGQNRSHLFRWPAPSRSFLSLQPALPGYQNTGGSMPRLRCHSPTAWGWSCQAHMTMIAEMIMPRFPHGVLHAPTRAGPCSSGHLTASYFTRQRTPGAVFTTGCRLQPLGTKHCDLHQPV